MKGILILPLLLLFSTPALAGHKHHRHNQSHTTGVKFVCKDGDCKLKVFPKHTHRHCHIHPHKHW